MAVIFHPSDPHFGEHLARARTAFGDEAVACWTAFNEGLAALSERHGVRLLIVGFEMDGVPCAAEHWATLVAAREWLREETKRRGNGHDS